VLERRLRISKKIYGKASDNLILKLKAVEDII
jgi:hypothetical protein